MRKGIHELTKPDILVDIEMHNIDSFDYDKSERIIAIGRNKARQALSAKTRAIRDEKKRTKHQGE